MWKFFLVLMVGASAVFGTGSASATTFEPRDFDALSLEAEQIVIGTARTAVSRRSGVREIVTDYRFDNLEIVKGRVPGASLTLTLLGGTVGADSLTVVGAPTFKSGVRYLVFVSGKCSVMFPRVGGQQGIFQLRTDKASGVAGVHDYAGRPVKRLPGRVTKQQADVVDTDSGQPISKAAFVDAIRGKLTSGVAR